MQAFIYCKIMVHVSGVYRTHHQEYITWPPAGNIVGALYHKL